MRKGLRLCIRPDESVNSRVQSFLLDRFLMLCGVKFGFIFGYRSGSAGGARVLLLLFCSWGRGSPNENSLSQIESERIYFRLLQVVSADEDHWENIYGHCDPSESTFDFCR